MNWLIRTTPQFKADLQAAVRYITLSLGNPSAAHSLLDEYARAVESVKCFPYSMPPYPSEHDRPVDYRAVDVGNYLAFYVVLDGVIEFRRFLHASTDFSGRLPQ